MLTIINQPFSKHSRLGDLLNAELAGDTWNEFDAAIAFVKRSGVKFVFNALREFAKAHHVHLAIGIDLRGTSIEGLQLLRKAVEPHGVIRIVHSVGISTFHPKIYIFRNAMAAKILIGSGNLTKGGLYTNFEGTIVVTLDLANSTDKKFLKELQDLLARWTDPTTDASRILDDALMTKLQDFGYIIPESRLNAALAKLRVPARLRKMAGKERESLFGIVRVPNPPGDVRAGAKAAPGTPATAGKKHVVETMDGFVMTLQQTDVGVGQTTPGASRRSPEIFIPLAARNYASRFWAWPDKFTEDDRKPGKWDRPNVKMRLAGTIIPVNMMTGGDKHDFRLRSEALRSAGQIDDILRIEMGHVNAAYDYYVEIIPKGSRDFAYYDSICSNTVRNSRKRFGYY